MQKAFQYLIILLFVTFALIAQADPIQLNSLSELPERDDRGFLPVGSDPVYYKNHSEGHWYYLSDSIRIEINRNQTKNPLLTYYIADINCADGVSLFTSSWNREKPGRSNALPQDIAQRDHVVYAQSGDFYSYRVKDNKYPGIIIREGKILYKKTAPKAWARVPDLANMAFFPSGRAAVFNAWEFSAKEYIDQGATTVVSFGPILVRDGEIVDLSSFEKHNEPRCCIGVIESGHYVGLLVEGRRNHSEGCDIHTCAQILYQYGCWDAINLDGGNTAAMLFMGESVQLANNGGVYVNDRAIPDILCVGTY